MINTVEESQKVAVSHLEDVWLFGYGSLIFKVDFPVLEQRQAAIRGWERRFWQGSHDHRGTPESPGRVVTLVESADAICEGMAFRVSPETFSHLDHREKNGYIRRFEPLIFKDEEHEPAEAIVYFASPQNAAFLGDAPLEEMAEQIATSIGPSGRNSDYLLQLDAALKALLINDEHVSQLAQRVRLMVAEGVY